jgi:hypothetical protein
MIKNYFFILAGLLCSATSFSQVPVMNSIAGTNVSCSAPGPGNQFAASASNNPTSYNWSVFPSSGVLISSSNSPNTTIVFPAPGTYTVYCSASNGSGTGSAASHVVTVFETPTVTFSGNTNLFCQGSSTNLQASPTVLSGSSTLSYSWTPSAGLSNTTGSAVIASPLVPTNYTVHLTMGICKNTAMLFVNVNPLLLSVNTTAAIVCKGSSVNLSASGAVSYTWSTGSNSSSVNILPPASTNVTVAAIDTNGCSGIKVIPVTVDTTCSDVWPGDANSDGQVDNTDVLELGYGYLSTGPARNNASNSWSAQHASNWSGTVSSGKNRNHADCNGDGTVNLSDTVAILNNFAFTHSFRSSASAGTELVLSSVNENMVMPGEWNKLDILLGDETAPADIYGLVFDVNFDNSMIEAGQAFVRFTPSFMNSNNLNVEFAKPDFGKGKIYLAAVRTNGTDASGGGKIGEFHFKVKQEISQGVVINVSISNSGKVLSSRAFTPLATNALPLSVNKNPAGLSKLVADRFVVYPNPAAGQLNITNASAQETNFSISDITGRVVAGGSFVRSTSIDATTLAAGTYFIRINTASNSTTQKLVIQK